MVSAGDWTRNGIDGGSVEAAFASGGMASRALCGSPSYVPGEHGPLVNGRGVADRRPTSSSAGSTRFPGPYDCPQHHLVLIRSDGRHRGTDGWWIASSHARRLGVAEFRPLAPMVMLSIGDIVNVVPQTPPYNKYGSVNEAQLAVWVPVVQS